MLKTTMLWALCLSSMMTTVAKRSLAQEGISPFPRVGVAGISQPQRPEVDAIGDRAADRVSHYLGRPEHRHMRNTLIGATVGLFGGLLVGSQSERKPITHTQYNDYFGPTEICTAHCYPGKRTALLGLGGLLAGGFTGFSLTSDGRFAVR